jgi:hypothetical protein
MKDEIVSVLIFNEVELIILLDKEGNVERKLFDEIKLYSIFDDLTFDFKKVVFKIVL